ncbi:hypothetical protein GCM10009639_66510 [Kitasatospora putterlickiae]|uniref:Integral membrane protein n=1 Tax=Kitasatospora putterlickiae TaxID=221725 RepID=A0ABN1YHF9_9ACTN
MSSSPRSARIAPPRRRAGRHLRLALGRRHSVRRREPLARPVDRARARAWLIAGLALAVGLAGVITAAVLGYRATGRTAEADRVRLHRTEATVLDKIRTEESGVGRWSGGYQKRTDTSVSWTTPDGLARTGTVEAPRGTATGSTLVLWLDESGAPATAPATPVGLVVGAVCTGLAGSATLAALIGGALALRLRVLDRRADRAWERSWARWEPRWSGRANQPQDD